MNSDTVTSRSGRTLHRVATTTTTPKENSEAKAIRIASKKATRLAENQAYLAEQNVSAFLKAISEAEGGGYDFKYGAVKGKRNDPWRFADYSTHPGAGFGGTTTASGMYQITIATWRDEGEQMGLADFSPRTQDLIAVGILRTLGLIEKIKTGDVAGSMAKAAQRWAALPQGPGLQGKYPKQPYVSYEHFLENYKLAGGQEK